MGLSLRGWSISSFRKTVFQNFRHRKSFLHCTISCQSSNLTFSKAKGALYAPLGVFLFCAYANKRFIRTSFFARISMPPPHPWVVISCFWGRSIFRDSEDGSIAKEDPRFRVPIKHPNYIMRYNETISGCDEYWATAGGRVPQTSVFVPPSTGLPFWGLRPFCSPRAPYPSLTIRHTLSTTNSNARILPVTTWNGK